MDFTQTESANHPDAPRIPPQRPRKLLRRWLPRIAAIFLGVVPLLLIELLLRLFGIGNDLSLVVPIPKAHGWYRLNPQFDESFFGGTDLSGPENRPFQLPKPPSTRRILVVGGSTVVGFPYHSEVAFPRHLQAALELQSDGQETIEVLNAGITAISSSIEVSIVEEGLRTQPDVIVVYSGHNEFYGAGAVAVSTEVLSPKWFRFLAVCRRFYLVQALGRLRRPRKPSQDLTEWLPGDLHIELSGKVFEQGRAAYKENLEAMANLSARARIPIVFVSPVANEHGQPPIENLKPTPNRPEESWRSKLQSGERELAWGKLPKALELLEAARQEERDNPQIHFRLAQAYEKSERTQDAIAHYASALELDGCRFRAPSIFRSIMAEVAQRHASAGARFVDLHQAICRESDIAVPGRKHFLEHVHFTWEGNRIVGTEIAKFLWQDVWKREWSTEQMLDDRTARNRLAVQEEDHIAALAGAIGFYLKAPFRDGMDAESLARELTRESVQLFKRLPTEQQQRFMEQVRPGSSDRMFEKLIQARLSTGNDELIESWLKACVVRQPWHRESIVELTDWLRKHGESELADRTQDGSEKWPE